MRENRIFLEDRVLGAVSTNAYWTYPLVYHSGQRYLPEPAAFLTFYFHQLLAILPVNLAQHLEALQLIYLEFSTPNSSQESLTLPPVSFFT